MLCGDHGNFLDIAEVIRRLELTILKGGIENHSGSTWARFIVEVCSFAFHVSSYILIETLFDNGKCFFT